MTGATAHGLRSVFDHLHWEKIPNHQGEKLLKNPEALEKLFMAIISGDVEFNPNHMELYHKTGRIRLHSEA